ncbi:MAG: hypothetical protein CMJ64_28585 [Planctomycetaceae bacterium]|nr:hypothetical protein [Planctomycetaceae bacterium]
MIATPILVAAQDQAKESPERDTSAIVAAAGEPFVAIALLRELPRQLGATDLVELQHLDRNLEAPTTEAEREFARELLLVLARSSELRSLGYVHQVFETVPWRRQDAARAIAEFAIDQRRRAADWRLLVRSLPVVDDDDARVILQSLQMFPQRGTKPHWLREVILAGLRSGDVGKSEAAKLLSHWTGSQLHDGDPTKGPLSQWQAWFDEKYPELPEPILPVDSPTSRYTYAKLLTFLGGERGAKGDPQSGANVFEKAQCIKCHRFGARGEAMGPDLTNVRQRFQLKQILEATVFPSQSITDQHETTTIVTTDGQIFSGVLAAADGKIVVLQANGNKAIVDRRDIEEALPSRKSAMPDGLLDPLSLDEIADLFAYMRDRQQ